MKNYFYSGFLTLDDGTKRYLHGRITARLCEVKGYDDLLTEIAYRHRRNREDNKLESGEWVRARLILTALNPV